MKVIPVSLKNHPHNIVVGYGILKQLGGRLKRLSLGKDALIITSPVIHRLHGKKLIASLKRSGFNVKVFLVPDGEKSKSAAEAFKLMEAITRYDVYKKSFIIAFGGGVIGDLAGYVAASYKRGIPYVQVPTTFLAQIDSAIGGKVAIDLPIGKNLVGAFYQPRLIWSDVSLLLTLDKRQIRNGLAEAVKYGVIADKKLFKFLQNHYLKLIKGDRKALSFMVERCGRIKAKVVAADEKETKGIRSILNFGHTLGHAIEAAGGFKTYQHGEAIALGMRIAVDMSVRKKMFSLKEAVAVDKLLTDIGLPQKISSRIRLPAILTHMKHDKKFVAGKTRFVLAQRIGKVKLVDGILGEFIKISIEKYSD